MTIELSNTERQELEKMAAKRSNSYSQVVLSQIILLSDEGVGSRNKVSRILGVSRDTVLRWRKRWVDSKLKNVKERLEDAPRPGAPVTDTPSPLCAIVALACELPIESGRPITHWTQEEELAF